jgi:hypothetical protein
MSGQFLVEPDPESEPDPEPVDELEDPVPVWPLPVPPVLPVLEFDDGVVVEELELVPELPELPVVVDVVAALATSAPPATRQDVSALTARMLRRRICMRCCPFVRVERRAVRSGTATVLPGSGYNRRTK